jgi:hypothetical protein
VSSTSWSGSRRSKSSSSECISSIGIFRRDDAEKMNRQICRAMGDASRERETLSCVSGFSAKIRSPHASCTRVLGRRDCGAGSAMTEHSLVDSCPRELTLVCSEPPRSRERVQSSGHTQELEFVERQDFEVANCLPARGNVLSRDTGFSRPVHRSTDGAFGLTRRDRNSSTSRRFAELVPTAGPE